VRARLSRVVVALVVVVVGGVPMLPGRALGTAVVTGESFSVCPDWDPTCNASSPNIYLSRIVYDARVASANTLTFEYEPGLNEAVCLGIEGPGNCGVVGSGPDRFVFTELVATEVSGAGLCRALGPRVGSCASPPGDGYYNVYPANAVDSLPVLIQTKALHDQITAVMPPLGQEFAFTISTGDGNDVITLVDNTGHAHGGADQIFCGPGNDRVTTNSDVSVGSDCELVNRLT
jgi:hypothetical protein